MKSYFLFLLYIAFSSNITAQEYQIVTKTDFNGAITEGSIEDLIKYIQEGKPVRLGWQLDIDGDGKADLEHWVNTEFLTINNGHVYSQVTTIHQQIPMHDNVQIVDAENLWYALISTKGIIQNKYVFENPPIIHDENGNPLSEEKAKEALASFLELQEDKVATTWAVLK